MKRPSSNFKKLFYIICLIPLTFFNPQASNQTLHSSSENPSQVVFEFSEVVTTGGDSRMRAVAFRSITFIDSLGQSLGSLLFGNSAANELQGPGWFENEVSGEVGSFQWAGGTNKQTEMTITVPTGTRGLLLKVNSAVDSLWMKVKIDGQIAGTLRVDAFWHSGYFPFGNVVPESLSNTEPEWIEGRYFPHFPSADRIIAIPIHNTKLSQANITGAAEFRINQEYDLMMALTLTCMQGIINRSKPRVYLSYHDSDYEWLSHIGQYTEIINLDLDKLSSLNFLFDKYSSLFSGIVVYDPDVPETINLANMIAALEDRIIVAPEQLDLPGMPSFNSVKDLRGLVKDQNWDTSEESKLQIYQWVYDSLWQDLEHRMIGIISPGPPTSQEYSPNFYFGMGLAIRDYYTALKLPILWLDPRDPAEATLYGRFLSDAPSPIPVHGASPWEVSSIPFVSSYGDWVTALSWPQNPLDGSNLTVFSGVRPEIEKYKPRIDPNRILATLHKQHVAMIFSSDGDNLGYQMYRGFNGFRWFDVIDQKATFGWTANPTLIDLAPVAWNYYMKSRNNVELLCGFSGAGYAQPRSMNKAQLKKFLEYTSLYLDQTGLKTIWILDYPNNNPWNEELASLYYEELHNPGVLGYIFGAGSNPWRSINFSYAGAPIPSLRLSDVLEEYNVDQVAHRILSQNNTDSTFINLGADYRFHSGKVIQDEKATGGEALLFSAKSQNYQEIITGPYIDLVPGDYTARFRLKVSEIQGAQDFVTINVSHPNIEGIGGNLMSFSTIALKEISPDVFQEANTYQDIEVQFSLDDIKLNLEFITSIRGENIDLTVDNIQIIKNDPDSFPVFAPLLIVTTLGGEQHKFPERFRGLFEGGGGILLSPDEFMAALNPQYMINLATPILGAGDSIVVKATQQYNNGEYFASLVTIRNGLKGKVTTSTTNPVQPKDFYLGENYPNPFNSMTTIPFSLSKPMHIKVNVFNTLGQKVVQLLNEKMLAGDHRVKLNRQNLEHGMYIIQVEAGAFKTLRKILYLP